ncbi:MAG: hypothetical protein ABIQ95_10330 [Bdellovibrionia bacterium]
MKNTTINKTFFLLAAVYCALISRVASSDVRKLTCSASSGESIPIYYYGNGCPAETASATLNIQTSDEEPTSESNFHQDPTTTSIL